MKIENELKKILFEFGNNIKRNTELGTVIPLHKMIEEPFNKILALGKPEPLAKNKQTQVFKPFKCNHCKRRFIDKLHHKCNTGYRKRNHSWSVIERGEENADATSR